MKNIFQKPFRWALTYAIILTGFTVFVLLDTFVIPKAIQTVPDAVSTLNNVSAATATITSSSVTESTDNGTDTSAHKADGSLYTANSYQDENISITITTERVYDTQVYIADIQLQSIAYLKTAFAQDTFGRNIKQKTSAIAEAHDAILAINGDYCGFRNYGFVIRNGVLYRDSARNSNDDEALVIYEDGSFEVVRENAVAADELLQQGAVQVFSFGPSLLNNGTVSVNENSEVARAKISNPRTAIGIISPLHYIMIVSDGRTKASAGLTLYQLAEIFKELGCETAYNSDGGGSSTMWFNGEIVNIPTDGSKLSERSVSDIVYIGY